MAKHLETKEELEQLQDECLSLRNKGISLQDIQHILKEKHKIVRTTMQIGRWIKAAAHRATTSESLDNFDVKLVRGMSELDRLQERIEEMLTTKIVEYKYTKTMYGKKKQVTGTKEIPPMVLAQLMNTLLLTLDKKNQIRGLNNNQIQMLVQNTYNSHHNSLTIGDEFKHLDIDVQKQLRNIFQESEELAQAPGAITLDGEVGDTEESEGVRTGDTE